MFLVFWAGVTLLSSSNNHQFVLHLTFLVEANFRVYCFHASSVEQHLKGDL